MQAAETGLVQKAHFILGVLICWALGFGEEKNEKKISLGKKKYDVGRVVIFLNRKLEFKDEGFY